MCIADNISDAVFWHTIFFCLSQGKIHFELNVRSKNLKIWKSRSILNPNEASGLLTLQGGFTKGC